MWLFKAFGLLLLFASSSLFGFLKSNNLKKSEIKLSKICRAMFDLAERLRTSREEIAKLLSVCFDESVLSIRSGEYFLNKSYLQKEDISLFNEFLQGLGMGEAEQEYERIKSFGLLFEKRRLQAEENSGKLGRLYSSLGVLFGIFICIFFV